ncbi:lysophospholipid acyltransferase family protein [Gluconobacter sp. Dm-44]|uniref:lysophospholipid acyltransferase family protein n=1 Tax=Gluconobacter sp. Dm-44 TaxID=2799805 RepID=UPI0032C3EF75
MTAPGGRHPLVAALVSRGMRRGIQRGFNAVRLSGDAEALRHRGPLVVCANHPGWWDPAVFAWLQHHFFGHCHGYGPMEAAALRRYPLLEKAGLIPIDPNDPQSLRQFVRVARDVLQQGHVLWITPQGDFADCRVRPVRLQPGFAHLVRHIPSVRLVPLAIEYPFWNENRPELLLRFGAPVPVGERESVRCVTMRMEAALTETMDALARDACTRDAARFTTFVQGRAGIGGLYDMGRRARQWGRRENFQPRHDP